MKPPRTTTHARLHRLHFFQSIWAKRGLALLLGSLPLVTSGLPLTLSDNRQSDPPEGNNPVVERFVELGPTTTWRPVSRVRLNFLTHHPQGMSRVGDDFYLSSVEVIEPTKWVKDGLHDRTSGRGKGHLFRFSPDGEMVADIALGEGAIYHPGGIDYDGQHLWVPVAEYRPDSRSIIYRVDPETHEAVEVFRFADHIGGLVHNTADGTLHGVSWGARTLYTWRLEENGEVTLLGQQPNSVDYIAYQDCQYLDGPYALCSGVGTLDVPNVAGFDLGGIDLLDLRAQVAVHQIPVPLYVNPSLVMTQNPFYAEPLGDRLRFYFAPADDETTLYIYDAPAD